LSNVRYQQALSKIQATVDKYTKEREDTLQLLSSKEVENAKLQVENDMLRATIEKFLPVLNGNLQGKGDPSPLMDYENEPVVNRGIRPHIKHEADRSRNNDSQDEHDKGIHTRCVYLDTSAAIESMRAVVKNQKLGENGLSKSRYPSRKASAYVDYTEPDRKKKLRQGDPDHFIIKAVDSLYVAQRRPTKMLPSHDDKENEDPRY